MSDSGTSEQQPPPINETINAKDKILSWLEAGRNNESIAMFGTSVEELLKILQLGFIPPYDASSTPFHGPSQVLEEGEGLFYFLPIIRNLKRKAPQIAQTLEHRLIDPDRKLGKDYAYEELTDGAEFYVRRYAVENAFSDKLVKDGVLTSHTNWEYGEDFLYQFDEPDFKPNEFYEDESEFTKILKKAMEDPIKKASIDDARKRKGVIIYFNPNIFEDSEFIEPYETEHEIILKRKGNLPLSAISGVEVFTEREREVLTT